MSSTRKLDSDRRVLISDAHRLYIRYVQVIFRSCSAYVSRISRSYFWPYPGSILAISRSYFWLYPGHIFGCIQAIFGLYPGCTQVSGRRLACIRLVAHYPGYVHARPPCVFFRVMCICVLIYLPRSRFGCFYPFYMR